MSRSEVVDVTVVGGGILGAAVAEECGRQGLRVCVLERGVPNREGSGTTAGNLHIQAIHSRRPGQEVPVDTIRLVPLQVRASDLWRDVEERLDRPIELRRNGSLMVAETPEQVGELQRKHRAEREAGLQSELVDEATLRSEFSFVGPSAIAADYCAADGYVNPLLVVPALLAGAIEHGATVHHGTTVTRVTDRSEGFSIEHTSGTVESGHLVLATGPWLAQSAALLGLRLAVDPVAIQMIVTERQPADITPLLVQHIGEGLSLKQVHAGNILIGGGWPAGPFQDEGRQPISLASLRGNLAQAARIVPIVQGMRVLRVWAGPLAAARDEMPVIGPISTHPGAYVVGGTYGITFAPLWARVIARHITGSTPEVAIPDLGPDRLLRGLP